MTIPEDKDYHPDRVGISSQEVFPRFTSPGSGTGRNGGRLIVAEKGEPGQNGAEHIPEGRRNLPSARMKRARIQLSVSTLIITHIGRSLRDCEAGNHSHYFQGVAPCHPDTGWKTFYRFANVFSCKLVAIRMF